MAAHEQSPRSAASDELIRLGRGGRQRLLDEGVLAGFRLRVARSKCVNTGVARKTASTFGSASSSSYDVVAFTSDSAGRTCRAGSASPSQIHATSTPSCSKSTRSSSGPSSPDPPARLASDRRPRLCVGPSRCRLPGNETVRVNCPPVLPGLALSSLWLWRVKSSPL